MHAIREEKFEPPTWEDVKKGYLDYYFIDAKQRRYNLYASIDSGILLNCNSGYGKDYYFKYTKENYEKAVMIAKKLFIGENDE